MVEVICWLLLAAIFIVIEIISLGLTTIWFAGGAFVAAIAAAFGVNVGIQALLFVVVAVLLLVFTRPLAMKHLEPNTEKTNSEALIGQTAIVLQEINNLKETGQAKINGMEWTARSKDDSVIEEGTKVKVVEISGVKLIVEKVTDDTKETQEERL